MKIGIDISPLSSGHSIRGIGFYLLNLKNALQEYFPDNEYIFFENEVPGNVELVHFPYFDPFIQSLPKTKLKTVITVHDLTPIVFKDEFPVGIKGNLKWKLQKRRLKNASGIITDSFSSKKDIISLTGVSEDFISVVYLAAAEHFKVISKAEREKIRKKFNLPEKFILYVGDVTWNKNLPNLMRAMIESDCDLVIAGKAFANNEYDVQNPWNKSFHEAKILSQGNPRIKALGFVSDDELVGLYNCASASILPSVYEGFGLPVIEAMQSGCPVIATKRGSLEEVADSAAYFVDPGNVDSIRNGIIEVMGNDNLRKALSKKGLMHAKKFSWKKTAEETLNVYEKVINTSNN